MQPPVATGGCTTANGGCESMIDLVAMCVKDLGLEVQDDATNIEAIADYNKLDPSSGDQL